MNLPTMDYFLSNIRSASEQLKRKQIGRRCYISVVGMRAGVSRHTLQSPIIKKARKKKQQKYLNETIERFRQ